MGVIRFARRLITVGLAAFGIMTTAMLAWTFLWSDPDLASMKRVDVIVCLGAGMDRNGNLGRGTQGRVERCVELYDAGLAPNVLFSGGTARLDGPSAGAQMGRYAQTLGLPASAVIVEGAAQSTLQNALFTLELIPTADTIILVTEAFHLPRSWASFQWAAIETGPFAPHITLVMSEPVRPNRDGTGISWRPLVRESMAIWFNIARAATYSLSPDPSIDWLH